MPHKFSPQNIERLLRKDRLGDKRPGELLKEAGLKKGMVFADIGCGPGFFSMAASRVVGKKGIVYAVDTQEEMIAELKKRIAEKNILPLKSEENSVPVDGAAVDFALLAYVLHETEVKGVFLKEAKRILKDGGTLLVIDWEKIVEEHGPPFEERIFREDAAALLREAGFTVKTVSSLNPSHYLIKAEK